MVSFSKYQFSKCRKLLIWVFVASQVVNDVKTAPLLGIVYALGYGVGVIAGSIVEKKMAFGKSYVKYHYSNQK